MRRFVFVIAVGILFSYCFGTIIKSSKNKYLARNEVFIEDSYEAHKNVISFKTLTVDNYVEEKDCYHDEAVVNNNFRIITFKPVYNRDEFTCYKTKLYLVFKR